MSRPTQTHYLQDFLRDEAGDIWGHESEARLAIHPSGTAVVFVHGFRGSAVKTWREFPTMLTTAPDCAPHDFFFLGYDSWRRDAAYSASEVHEFLNAVGTEPAARLVNPSLPKGAPERTEEFYYRHIVICAHSLGAVVTRLALLDASSQSPPDQWLPRVRLVFFAPAHMGARIIPLVALGLAGIKLPLTGGLAGGDKIEAFLRYRMPVLTDLDPKESLTLPLIRAGTEKALSRGLRRNAHLRARVLHGERDHIVFKERFVADYPMERHPGAGHLEVCKPNLRSLRPLQFLHKHLP